MSSGTRFGCGGGDERYAMYYLAQKTDGLIARKEYMYENKQGTCREDYYDKIVSLDKTK